jgi:hypothetical protein
MNSFLFWEQKKQSQEASTVEQVVSDRERGDNVLM